MAMQTISLKSQVKIVNIDDVGIMSFTISQNNLGLWRWIRWNLGTTNSAFLPFSRLRNSAPRISMGRYRGAASSSSSSGRSIPSAPLAPTPPLLKVPGQLKIKPLGSSIYSSVWFCLSNTTDQKESCYFNHPLRPPLHYWGWVPMRTRKSISLKLPVGFCTTFPAKFARTIPRANIMAFLPVMDVPDFSK